MHILICLAVVAALLFFWLKRRRRNRNFLLGLQMLNPKADLAELRKYAKAVGRG
jgi:hypothetical protein